MKKIVKKHPVDAKEKKKIYKNYVVKKVVVFPDRTEYYVEKKKKRRVENETDKGAVPKRK